MNQKSCNFYLITQFIYIRSTYSETSHPRQKRDHMDYNAYCRACLVHYNIPIFSSNDRNDVVHA